MFRKCLVCYYARLNLEKKWYEINLFLKKKNPVISPLSVLKREREWDTLKFTRAVSFQVVADVNAWIEATLLQTYPFMKLSFEPRVLKVNLTFNKTSTDCRRYKFLSTKRNKKPWIAEVNNENTYLRNIGLQWRSMTRKAKWDGAWNQNTWRNVNAPSKV